MAGFKSDIDAALLTDEPLQKEKVLVWINATSDLPTLAKLYRLHGEGYYRIQPELGGDASCSLIQRYLLECIRQNVIQDVDIADENEIQDRWEAARTLHGWLCQLAEMNDSSAQIGRAASAITELYLTTGEDVQLAIEQGFLEHALEMAALRPYFEHWSSDDRLRPAWERSLEWGLAHPNFIWGMLQGLKGLK